MNTTLPSVNYPVSDEAAAQYLERCIAVALTNVTISTIKAGDVLNGITLTANDRVLLAGQTDKKQGGTYSIGASAGLTKRTDDEFIAGVQIPITGGSPGADTIYAVTNDDPIVLGTTELTFIKIALDTSLLIYKSALGSNTYASNTTSAFKLDVTGDTQPRFEMLADGTMKWGTGSATSNASMKYSGGQLQIHTAPTTADATADVIIAASATTQTPLVLQMKAGQSVPAFEVQDSTGVVLASIGGGGNVSFPYTTTMGSGSVEVSLNLLALGSGTLVNWSSTVSASGTPDLGFIRSSAGIAKLTDGSTGLGQLYLGKNNITTTSTDGLVIANDTASLVGTPVQQSPRLRFRSNVWNTDGSNDTFDAWFESIPNSVATTTNSLKLKQSKNGAASTTPYSFSMSAADGSYVFGSDGYLTLTGLVGTGYIAGYTGIRFDAAHTTGLLGLSSVLYLNGLSGSPALSTSARSMAISTGGRIFGNAVSNPTPHATASNHTSNGTLITITTTAAHNLIAGQVITLAGWTWSDGGGSINLTYLVNSTPTTTTLTLNPATYGGTCPTSTTNPSVVGTITVNASLQLGIAPTSPAPRDIHIGGTVRFNLASVPAYANNAAAIGGGLTAGDLYRTNADPDTLCIVH